MHPSLQSFKIVATAGRKILITVTPSKPSCHFMLADESQFKTIANNPGPYNPVAGIRRVELTNPTTEFTVPSDGTWYVIFDRREVSSANAELV